MFAIKRTDQGRGYVAKPGRAKSYTNTLTHAQLFSTKEEADRHRCPGNEMVVEVFRNGYSESAYR